VIEAVASLAEQLCRQTEEIHVLTTSRELLKVAGEHCYRVLPLDFPPGGSEQTANAVLRYPAAQLFVQCVVARSGNLRSHRRGGTVCRRDVPKAGWSYRWQSSWPQFQVAALGIKNTVARLMSRAELLKLSHRTAVPRHRTLMATLDWSYDLLSDAERTVFRRIAPFVGHFTLEGARWVAGELGADTREILEAIAGLVEKSVITTRLDAGQQRYRLLDTTRAYALEKLEEHGELEAIFSRHAKYVAEFLELQRETMLALPRARRTAAYSNQLKQHQRDARIKLWSTR